MRYNFNQKISIPTVEGKPKPPSNMIFNSTRRLVNNPSFQYNREKLSNFGVNQLHLCGDSVSSRTVDQGLKTVNVNKFLNLKFFYPEPAKIEILIISSDGRFLETSRHNSYGKFDESIDISDLEPGKHFLQITVTNNNLDKAVYKRYFIKESFPFKKRTNETVHHYGLNPSKRRGEKVKRGLQRTALIGGLALASLPLFSQKHDLDFKVRELTHGTGANIANVKVDLDDGKYIGFTDANGVAHIHDVNDGTHRIKVSKQGYIQFLQDGYVLDANKTFNASVLKKNQVGPWGNVDFNVSWWRQTFATVGTDMWNADPRRWEHYAPILNRISPTPAYTYTDSVNIVTAINEIEAKTGLDLISLIPNSASPDTTYTIYTHSGNVSSINSLNGIIYKGYSEISVTSPTKRVIHEIVKQFDMWPIYTTAYTSVMEPDTYIMADMQPWDANHIAVTMRQHLAKQRGEQDLFMGNTMEYVTPVTPASTSITLPINNSTDLEKIVRFTYNNVAGTDRYHLDIATDELFNTIVNDLMIYRNDTTITLNNDQQYYVRVRQENIAGNSNWSSTIAFQTQSIPTGINDLSDKREFKLYPNPFSNCISITTTKNKFSKLKIDLFLSDGRLIKSLTTSNSENLNLSDLRQGSYIIRISYLDNSGPAETLTIIKK